MCTHRTLNWWWWCSDRSSWSYDVPKNVNFIYIWHNCSNQSRRWNVCWCKLVEVDNETGPDMLADWAFWWKSGIEAVVGNWSTRAGEDPVQAQLILPLLAPRPPCSGAVPDPHLGCKMYLSQIDNCICVKVKIIFVSNFDIYFSRVPASGLCLFPHLVLSGCFCWAATLLLLLRLDNNVEPTTH